MEPEKLAVRVKDKFLEISDSKPLMFRAPGRINLIGEHTDYNDGFVLPGAIDYSILFAMNVNYNGNYRFFSYDFNKDFTANSIEENIGNNHWASYLLGVIAQFQNEGFEIGGLDCVFGGNIPVGAGLSSSAALECGFAFGINSLYEFGLPDIKLAKMAQKAEHDFAGVKCGIIDQFASIFGKEGKVFRLDCRSLAHQYFDFNMSDYSLVLVNTNVKHSLASSEYNVRRKECEDGVTVLRSKFKDIKALRDATIDQLELMQDNMSKVTFKRCSYVINENQRVIESCNAIQESDFKRFGELMYKSHEGLQNDYEVSCKELDILVEATKNMDFVLGSRMMGGGFGGCTLNMVRKGFEKQFENEILKIYKAATKIDAQVYKVKLGNGAEKI